MCLEPATLFLRYVRLDDYEIVRGIYGAIRDRNWDTVPGRVSDLQVHRTEDSFRATARVECVSGEIDFGWNAEIAGEPDGTVSYVFEGTARSSFLKNRIGLCVLHPMAECAGQPCQVLHTNGQVEESSFPAAIAPDQPFLDVSALRYSAGHGQRIEVQFEGEVFEVEDQRNWTDASFKTYSTPLVEPFPVQLQMGARIKHTVRILLLEPQRRIFPVIAGRCAELSISPAPALTRPPVGVVLGEDRPSPRQVAWLRALQLAHLRIDLRLGQGCEAQLRDATQLAKAIGTTLHLATTLSPDTENEFEKLMAAVEQIRPPVSLWLVYHEDESKADFAWVEAVRAKLNKFGAPMAAGTRAWFAELNRFRPDPRSGALPCYSINPQVHAFDNLSLIEALATQPVTVHSARQFCPHPVAISWISLRPQSNPNATSATNLEPGALPSEVDSRQSSLFGAAWTLGSLAQLSVTGHVHSLTYYEAVGWRGLMEREEGSRLPEKFSSSPGAIFPLYHVLADMAGYNQAYPTESTHPLQLMGLTLANHQGQRRILVANLLGDQQRIRIKSGPAQAHVRILDQTSLERAVHDPDAFCSETGRPLQPVQGTLELELGPYATARIDLI